MNIGSASGAVAVKVAGEQQVKVLNNQKAQQEEVVGTIMDGVGSTPQPGKGEKIDTVA